jgi:asparagine synthase (glutamine-hydrolysing)
MSDFVGIYFLDRQPVLPTDLDRLVNGLSHRGADGTNIWIDGSVGLGHCMLWTTPESLHEQLPLIASEEGLALTADARIDNREELIAELDLGDHLSREISDSELILAAYKKWGEACPLKLLGDFAFAIWDGRDQRIFCARDIMGLKPFYYYHFPNRVFIFSSQIRGLLSHPEVPRKINELKLADHLALLKDDRSITFFEDIFSLPAAHSLSITAQGVHMNCYWKLDASRELLLASEADYVEAFREVFAKAIRCRLRSVFPVGAMLSGGLDSSSIVAMARDLFSKDGLEPLLTFSAIFPDLAENNPKLDERHWIEAVINQGGLTPNYIYADRLDPLEALNFYEDEPYAVPNMWLDWFCFKAGSQVGIRAILSGFDGDTAISYGHGYFADLIRSFDLRTLYLETTALARKLNRGRRYVIWDYGLAYLMPQIFWRMWYFLRREKERTLTYDPPINPTFAQRIGLDDRVQAIRRKNLLSFPTARELHLHSINSGIIKNGCELIEKAGAALGIELRLPFFDRRLLEFVLALPTGLKLKQGWNRYIMRRAMQGLLPEKVQWRLSKSNLSPNIRRGLLENREILETLLPRDGKIIEQYIDNSVVQEALDRFFAQPMQSKDADIFRVLIAYTLAQWLRKWEFVN